MELQSTKIVSFSPTHTSHKVAEAIAKGIGYESINKIDVTLKETQLPCNFSATEVAVAAVPVYGGHVAPLAVQRLTHLKAEGTPAVAVVVYGNRDYEHALEELATLLTDKGFKVIAGATFIGEHSYSTDDTPIAAGRPNRDDLDFAHQFGEKIRAKIDLATNIERLNAVDVHRIKRPSQSIFSLFGFIFGVIKIRKGGKPSPRTPLCDKAKCKACGACVKVCPTGAITLADPTQTDENRCIRCCACVKVCSKKARTFPSPFAQLLYKYFKKPKQNRIII